MNTEIGIWEIDRASRAGTKLGTAERVETEEMLEAVLVANPNMLMRGLKLIGRQVPVPTGYVDLLGLDEDGRLVVFELKREKLTRDAVAQILDYCSCLKALSDSELATLIADRSGKDGETLFRWTPAGAALNDDEPSFLQAIQAARQHPDLDEIAKWLGWEEADRIEARLRPRLRRPCARIDRYSIHFADRLSDFDIGLGGLDFDGATPEPLSYATKETPLMFVPESATPALPVAIVLRSQCISGSMSGLGATPVSLSKNCPVVECLSHSPPAPGVAPVVSIGDQ